MIMNYNFLVEQEVDPEEILNSDHLLIGKCPVLGRIILLLGSISPSYFYSF